ncbi:ABC transporter [Carpediemonas membranifera]|uniref:ABC transporter n=1 Tax=Carpediemonas membranifera TaxID=201153 RepID=A0A8J6EBL6_9EUKA|nr:ABC transporter [Carpediemonas membranifera]|eukprot:KAG9397675.1 ABC transporter [Carpediemonas membranifera]
MDSIADKYYHWINQVRIFALKQWRITYRAWFSSCCLILCPIIFIVLLAGTEAWMRSAMPDYEASMEISTSGDPDPVIGLTTGMMDETCESCSVVMAIAPDNADTQAIRTRVLANEGLDSSDIEMFASAEALNANLLSETNRVFGAVVFSDTSSSYSYAVQYNHTAYSCQLSMFFPVCPDAHRLLVLPFTRAVDRAIAQIVASDTSITHDIVLQSFPHPMLSQTTVMSLYAPVFIFLMSTVHMVIHTASLLSEKENHHHTSLRIVGLLDSVYWTVWVLAMLITSLLSFAVMFITCFVFDWIGYPLDLITGNSIVLVALLFILYAISSIVISILITAVVDSVRVGTVVAFLYFIVGVIFGSLAQSYFFTSKTNSLVRFLLSLAPPVVFQKLMADLAVAGVEGAESISFSNIADNADYLTYLDGLIFMVVDILLILVPTLYLQAVVPSNGTGLHWSLIRKRRSKKEIAVKDQVFLRELRPEVHQERERVVNILKTTKQADRKGIIIKDLRKIFRIGLFRRKFIAVEGSSLAIDSGTILCLLGQNGAGKTTTISMLTGQLPMSSGEVFVDGHAMPAEMGLIRHHIGLCPQFDIMWPTMTAKEHIQLFGALKGLSGERLDQETIDRLEEVNLTSKTNIATKKFSGGMRRRLSLAIAFTGSPSVVFLDEPTTGLDPVTRSAVWETVRRHKHGKAIILTTHSMEEADVLGDRIAIMAAGRMMCVGKSLTLKNAFDAGYHIALITEPGRGREVLDLVGSEHVLRDIDLRSQTADSVILSVPRDAIDRMPDILRRFDLMKSAGLLAGYTVSLTTLEDVFLMTSQSVSRARDGRPEFTVTGEGKEAPTQAASDAGSDGPEELEPLAPVDPVSSSDSSDSDPEEDGNFVTPAFPEI